MENAGNSSARSSLQQLIAKFAVVIENKNPDEIRTVIGALVGYIYNEIPEDDVGYTLLHLAAQVGGVNILKALVEDEIVNVEDDEGHTPLEYLLERENLDEIKILIDAGAHVNSVSLFTGKTALTLAVEKNDTSFAEYLLSRGAEVNPTAYYRTPLQIAAEKCIEDSHLCMIEVLLKNGADVNAADSVNNTPLTLLLDRKTNVKTVKLLLDFNADVSGEISLVSAVKVGNAEIVQLLLDRAGSEIVKSSSDEYRKTLLQHAASENKGGSHFATIEVLLKHGADINAQNYNGNTPFHKMVRSANLELVKLFLDHKADFHVKNYRNETEVFSAARGGNFEVMKLLIDLGLGVNVVNYRGETPLFNAAESGSVKVFQLLLDHGLDVNVTSEFGETPLFRATKSGNVVVTQLLIDLGSDVDSLNNRGETPLFYAVKSNNLELVQLLIKYDADVYIRNREGDNPMFTAVRIQNLKILELLLDHCGDFHGVNKRGENLLHQAVCYYEDSDEILKFLLKEGADINALDNDDRTPLTLLLLGESAHCSSFKKTFQLMLKYSDVNEEGNNDFLNYCSYERDWKVFLERIAELKALDLPINSKIIHSVSNRDKYSVYFEQCAEELNLAKNTKLENCWVTFFNILTDSKRKLKNYAGNADLIKGFEMSDCLIKFPIYGSSMKKNMEKGIKRRKLFDKSAAILSKNWPIFGLSHLVIRDLLDCFGTKDLSKFCE